MAKLPNNTAVMVADKSSVYSASAMLVAQYYNYTVILNAVFGASLSNRTLYNNSVRIVSNDQGFVNAWLLMIKLYGWTRFALLITEDAQGTGFFAALVASLDPAIDYVVVTCPTTTTFATVAERTAFLQNMMSVVAQGGYPIVLTIGNACYNTAVSGAGDSGRAAGLQHRLSVVRVRGSVRRYQHRPIGWQLPAGYAGYDMHVRQLRVRPVADQLRAGHVSAAPRLVHHAERVHRRTRLL